MTGASSGIGKAVAELFAREGAAVVVVHHDHPEDAEKVIGGIVAAGGKALAIAADVRGQAQVDAVFEGAVEAFGAPTILVNAAGVDAAGIPVADMEADHFEMVLRTNLVGPFLFCRAFVRDARRAKVAAGSSRLALYLASDAAGYATGATFTLDGGLAMNLGQGA